MALFIPAAEILAPVARLRNDGSSGTFCFGTYEKPFRVGNGKMYAVKFPDGNIWAVRIPWFAAETLTASSITDLVQDETETLKELDKAWLSLVAAFDWRRQ